MKSTNHSFTQKRDVAAGGGGRYGCKKQRGGAASTGCVSVYDMYVCIWATNDNE